MSAAIKCDRCREFEAVRVKQSEVDLQFVSATGDENSKTFSTTTYELCVGCTAALRKWLATT